MRPQDRHLIEQLEYNAQMGEKPLERRIADLCVWFFSHKDDIPRDNLASRQLFLEKAVWVLIEIAALQAERLHELEGNRPGSSLFLPKGVTMNGDAKEFG